MAQDLFYLPSYKNVGALFTKMETAKAPKAFTTRYLADVIGLRSAVDRSLIKMLKKMGFLDATGRPTEAYGLLKNKSVAKAAIADGLPKVYAPLFEANEKANELSSKELKGLIAYVTGSDTNIVGQIAYTFNAFAKNADFSQAPKPDARKSGDNKGGDNPPVPPLLSSSLRSDLHFNIQVYLPAKGTEETFFNIFNALGRTFS